MNRAQALAYLRRLQPELVPVAAPRPGICCETCRSGVGPGYNRCIPCNRHDVPPVLPISISVHGRGLHRRLRNYKDATAKAGRRECSLDLAVLLYLFLERHSDCLGGMPDIVVTVPSTDRDALRAVIKRLPGLRDRRLRVLRAVGSKTERRYEVDEGASQRVAGRRVLLLDDTFTTGKSITAAYSTLANAAPRSSARWSSADTSTPTTTRVSISGTACANTPGASSVAASAAPSSAQPSQPRPLRGSAANPHRTPRPTTRRP